MAPNARPMRGPGGGRGMMGRGGPKVKNPGKVMSRLLGIMLHYYGPQCLLVVVCILGSSLAMVQGTMFTQTLIDGYILPMIGQANPDFAPLGHAMMKVVGWYALGVVCTCTYQMVMISVSQGTLKRIRDDLFTHMESLPLRYFDSHSHGDIMSLYTNDVDTLRQMISQSIPQMISSVVTVVSVLVSMLLLSVPLTILNLLMVGLMLFITKTVAGSSAGYFAAQQKNLGKVNGFIEEMMDGQKVVKVFSHEEKNVEAFTQLNEELYQAASKANGLGNLMGPINMNLGNFGYVVVAIGGACMAIAGFGGLTLGKLASFLQFNRSFNQPISQVSQQLNSIIMALAGAERVFAVMDEPGEQDSGFVTLVNARETENGELEEVPERTGTWAWKVPYGDNQTMLVQVKGDIRVEHLDFGYVPEKTVLHDMSLFARPGEKIAFVGSTGAGKTTITNLLNRFYDVPDGKIRYDGIDVNKIKRDDLRRSLGIVLQDTHLFTGTVMENIRYGRLDAPDEEVIAAAKLAGADKFIRHLPDGYNTMLTGDGANLSQGQRQLLAIARAAVADPPVLILDEATSSIDTRTEALVQKGMDGLMYGRTSFVIAHRLSTVRGSDAILVLEHGCIVERGTHEQLMAEKGRYYQLYTGKFELD